MTNSLENTVLLYDILMRNQGLKALQWSEKLDKNPLYAWKLGSWYAEFSGITIQVLENGEYKTRGRVGDTGPIAWRNAAVRVPLDTRDDTLSVRLSFLPDNILVDWVAFDFDTPELELRQARCAEIRDQAGARREDAIEALSADDEQYCVTYPGESLDMTFSAPTPLDVDRTFFVSSNGFYVEWIRPAWVREAEPAPGFDLAKGDLNRMKLAELWVAKKDSFEGQFFSYRVPVRDWEDPR
jgi:hypothetical protein